MLKPKTENRSHDQKTYFSFGLQMQGHKNKGLLECGDVGRKTPIHLDGLQAPKLFGKEYMHLAART